MQWTCTPPLSVRGFGGSTWLQRNMLSLDFSSENSFSNVNLRQYLNVEVFGGLRYVIVSHPYLETRYFVKSGQNKNCI